MAIPRPVDPFAPRCLLKPVRIMFGCVLYRSELTLKYYVYFPMRTGLFEYNRKEEADLTFEAAAYRCMQARRAVHGTMRKKSRLWQTAWVRAGKQPPNHTIWMIYRDSVPKNLH